MSTPPPKCYHCGKPALFLWAEKIPLCIDCDIKMQQIQAVELDKLERTYNWAVDQFDFTTGFPSDAPRFPERQPVQITGGVTLNNIRIDNSSVGVLNTGNLQMVDSAVSVLKNNNEQQLAQAISQLTEAVASDAQLRAEDKNELVECLSILSSEATLAKEERKTGAMKALIARAYQLIQVSNNLTQLWGVVGPIIKDSFA